MTSIRSATAGRLVAAALLASSLSAVALPSSSSARTARGGSGSNGVASEPVNSIVAAANQAAQSLNTVVVSGTENSGGTKIGLNLTLKAGVGSEGSISLNGNTVQLVTLGNTVYMKGGTAFWKSFGNAAIASLLTGRWLKAPGTGSYAGILQLGNLHDLFSQTLGAHGKLAKSAPTKVRGIPAIGLTDTTQGGTLYVATTGKPYPLAIVNTGKSGGALNFTNFNSSVKITAPSGAVDLNALKKAG